MWGVQNIKVVFLSHSQTENDETEVTLGWNLEVCVTPDQRLEMLCHLHTLMSQETHLRQIFFLSFIL